MQSVDAVQERASEGCAWPSGTPSSWPRRIEWHGSRRTLERRPTSSSTWQRRSPIHRRFRSSSTVGIGRRSAPTNAGVVGATLALTVTGGAITVVARQLQRLLRDLPGQADRSRCIVRCVSGVDHQRVGSNGERREHLSRLARGRNVLVERAVEGEGLRDVVGGAEGNGERLGLGRAR